MAIVAFACTRDRIVENPNVGQDPNNGNNSNTDVVTFGFNFENTWTPDVIGDGQQDPYDAKKTAVTISRSQATPMECDKDGAIDNIYMYMVEENIPAIAKCGDATRAEGDSNNGESVTTDNGYGNIGIIAFHTIDGEDNSTTKVFMDNINLAEYDNKTYWPAKGGNIDFYAYYPYYNAQTASSYYGDYKVTYGLTDGGYSTPQIEYEVPVTVDEQYDLMRGYAQTGDYSSSSVEIDMSHLLSQIQVELGTIDQGEITSIAINNVYYKGKNSYVEVIDSEAETVKLVPQWSVVKDAEGDKLNYTITEDNGIVKNGDDIVIKPMYLMPQELPDNAEIVVTIQVSEGTEYCLKKNLSEITSTWLPNKKYTYTISTPQEVEVDVTDRVVSEGGAPQKKDLVISNIGMATAYIRLDMVGAWCVDKENIINGVKTTETLVVGDWKPAEDGTFVWADDGGAEPTTSATVRNWRKGADGYYYYMKPLRRSQKIEGDDALFKSYTLSKRGPMADAYLEFSILVQAVLKDDARYLWPEDIKTELGINN